MAERKQGMSADESERIWTALAEQAKQIGAMRSSMERVETAIAGNAALRQPGMVDRQAVLEASQERIEERMGKVEGRVIFASGFIACIVAGWEAIKHLTK